MDNPSFSVSDFEAWFFMHTLLGPWASPVRFRITDGVPAVIRRLVMVADPLRTHPIAGTIAGLLIGAPFLWAVISTALAVYAVFYSALH
jgi:hypothetical protein